MANPQREHDPSATGAEARADSTRNADQHHAPASLAKFTLLYESRDGRFCLYEDGDGHLTAVDSARFA